MIQLKRTLTLTQDRPEVNLKMNQTKEMNEAQALDSGFFSLIREFSSLHT